MRASWIFSKNDVIANVGVMLAGLMVYFFNTRWPDLAIGLLITVIVLRGGVAILRDAERERSSRTAPEGADTQNERRAKN